jgi:excisionase family DNA binding protein
VNATVTPAVEPAMIDAKGVARMLGCSSRHVARLAENGRLPSPVKIGRLVRWPRQTLLDWISAGCPATNS